MNNQSVTEKVNVCELVFTAVENQIPDDHAECYEVLDKIRKIIGDELFNSLESSIGYRVYKAQQAGFQVGWQMRGQV